jgi:hypothetical protein
MATNLEKLEHYMRACSDASTRSRYLIFLLAITSVLAFSSYWNSRQDSWPRLRYATVTRAMEFTYPDTGSKYSLIINNPRVIDSIKRYIDGAKLHSIDKMKEVRNLYQEMKKESYMVRIPILGISFDINDLGIITGLTYLALLLLLAFVIEREKDNIELTFAQATQCQLLPLCYDRMSMSQVLTIPFALRKKAAKIDYAVQWIPKAFLLPPVFIQWLIYIHDYATKEWGYYFSVAKTNTLFTFTFILSALITIISAFCIWQENHIDRIWKKAYKNAKSEIETDQNQVTD